MRWLLAMIKHRDEYLFARAPPTPLERFFRGSPDILAGERAIKAYENTDSGLGGYIEVARREGAEMVVPVAAESWPSGPTSADTHEQLCKLVLDQVKRGGFDAILLDLHGAMVAEGVEDAEGDLLRRLREIDPKRRSPSRWTCTPTSTTTSSTTPPSSAAFTPIRTWTSAKPACVRRNVIVRTLKGEIKPVDELGQQADAAAIMCQGTHAAPNKPLQERCKELKANGVLAASVFVGFPHADIREAGLSAVVCTDGKLQDAEKHRDELLERAWAGRADWVFHPEPLAPPSRAPSRSSKARLCCWTTSTTPAPAAPWTPPRCLPKCCARNCDNVVFYAICDPEAALQAAAAGRGQDHYL